MKFSKVTGVLLVAVLILGIANADVIETVKVSTEGASKFTIAPKIVELAGQKVFASIPKILTLYSLKKKIKVDPKKKYKVSVKVNSTEKILLWSISDLFLMMPKTVLSILNVVLTIPKGR